MGNQQIHLDQDANLKAANPCTKYLHSTSLLHQLSSFVDEPVQLLLLQSHVKIEGKKFHTWKEIHCELNFSIEIEEISKFLSPFGLVFQKNSYISFSWVGCYYKLVGTPEEKSFPFFSRIAFTIETSVVEQFFFKCNLNPFVIDFNTKRRKIPE